MMYIMGTSLCTPQTSIREFIGWELHAGGFAGNFGQDNTIALVVDWSFWPCHNYFSMFHLSIRSGYKIEH